MADVRSMMKRFQGDDNNMSADPGDRPALATKPLNPALKKFQQARENAAGTSGSPASSSSPSPSIATKPALPGVKLPGLMGGELNSVLKSRANSDTSRTTSDNGPKVFQNGSTPGANDTNNNSGIKNKFGGSNISPGNTNSAIKPPGMRAPTQNSNSTKPFVPSSKFGQNAKDSSNSSSSTSPKAAILPKKPTTLAKSDSISSTTSSSSSASNVSPRLPSSPPPTSPVTSPSSNDTDGGAFDLRSMLKKVDRTSGTPVKRVLTDLSSELPPEPAPTPKSPTSPTTSNTSLRSSAASDKAKPPSRVPPIPTSNGIQMRNKQDPTPVVEILVRKSDGKKFQKLSLPDAKPGDAPAKPTVPAADIDLTSLREQYNQALKIAKSRASDNKSVPSVPAPVPPDEQDDGELYWDSESAAPPTTPPKPVVQPSRTSQRISLIPEMSAEDEGLPVYDDTPIDEDIYDDAMSEKPGKRDPRKTSVSSESQSETEQERKKRIKEEANSKRKEEKDKKDKEKKEKEEERKRKKKEEEEQKLKNKFNLTGQEKDVGEGVIKQDAKASGLNLKVKKGQIVTIVRLDCNPPNKWLVKLESQMGYVDSQNIEVDPNIIRQAMTGQTEEEDFDQPTYDAVPEECGSSSLPIPDDLDDGEIYEECS